MQEEPNPPPTPQEDGEKVESMATAPPSAPVEPRPFSEDEIPWRDDEPDPGLVAVFQAGADAITASPLPDGTVLVPASPAPPELVEAERSTLLNLVQSMTSLDEAMGATDFNPEALVGQLKGKVDALKFVLDCMDARASYLKAEVAAPIVKKARAIDNNRDRLRDYIAFCMEVGKFETLPGDVYRVDLQRTPDRVTLSRPPKPEDMQAYPGMVKVRVERVYSWDGFAIESALKKGGILADDFPGKLESTPFVKFHVNTHEKLAPKPKGKRAPKEPQA